jgi:ectoine hydroxylase-related dioxygenase (phytanoyl-CoA dioxygenase family)
MATTALHTHPATSPTLATDMAASVNAEGYAIVTGVLDADECAALVNEVHRVEADHNIAAGTNNFEGLNTRRIFDLIGKSPLFRELVIRESTLAAAEAILGADLLLSGTTSMNIGPGETVQPIHTDDGMITLPRPHIATMLTTLWALSDFRADNGGTCFVPGSHAYDHGPGPAASETPQVVHAEMPAGSVLFLHGSTWHGGGANVTADEHRYGLSIQYVAGWCRQQQNLMIGTDRDTAATYPRRLQELIGYGLFRNVMGHVNREDPITLLGVEQDPNMVWEKM